MNYLTKRQIMIMTNRVLDCDKYEMIDMDKVIYIFSDSIILEKNENILGEKFSTIQQTPCVEFLLITKLSHIIK